VDYDISQLSMSRFSRSREKYITEQELMSINWIKLHIYLYLFYIVESGVKHHYPYICKKSLKIPKGQPQSVNTSKLFFCNSSIFILNKGRRGRDSIVVGFTTTYVINPYHH
jgi:hypothetical protein